MGYFCEEGCMGTTMAKEARYIPDQYCKLTGQLVNYHKSNIKLFKEINEAIRQEIADFLLMKPTNSMSKYLGFPNINQKKNKSEF